MLTLVALSLVAFAEPDCDAKAMGAELAEASPIAISRLYVELVQCDAKAGKKHAGEALSRMLEGNESNEAVGAALSVGAAEEVRSWMDSLEPDQRSRTIRHLGTQCSSSEAAEQFLLESHERLGSKFFEERFHRGLGDCRTAGIQALLKSALEDEGVVAERTQYFSILEVYSRNLGADAVPVLEQLAGELPDDEVLLVVSAFADAANVGGTGGIDTGAAVKAVAALTALGPSFSPGIIDQARSTLDALGSPDVASSFAKYRWPEKKVDDKYVYTAVCEELVTCKNGKKQAYFHHGRFTEGGDKWPAELSGELQNILTTHWTMDAAEKCKGEGEFLVEMSQEPIAEDDEAAREWLARKIQAFRAKAGEFQKAAVIEESQFDL
jgi:hypothetical protein